MERVLNILLIVFVIVIAVLAVLYFLCRKVEKKQVEQQNMLEAAAQSVSILVIDKKKMKLKDANLPKAVFDQTPKYLQRMKVPVVKAKIGPKVMTLLADGEVFNILPVKTEARVVISGIYITQVKSIRGGTVPTAPRKKGFLAKEETNTSKKKK